VFDPENVIIFNPFSDELAYGIFPAPVFVIVYPLPDLSLTEVTFPAVTETLFTSAASSHRAHPGILAGLNIGYLTTKAYEWLEVSRVVLRVVNEFDVPGLGPKRIGNVVPSGFVYVVIVRVEALLTAAFSDPLLSVSIATVVPVFIFVESAPSSHNLGFETGPGGPELAGLVLNGDQVFELGKLF
jgi:hypothetical protein